MGGAKGGSGDREGVGNGGRRGEWVGGRGRGRGRGEVGRGREGDVEGRKVAG